MRPGDYITVNRSEAELLTSDRFKQAVSSDLVQKIRLTPPRGRAPEGYKCLSLPKIGRPVAEALRGLATAGSTPEAVVAEHLAERIEERITLT